MSYLPSDVPLFESNIPLSYFKNQFGAHLHEETSPTESTLSWSIYHFNLSRDLQELADNQSIQK